MWLNVQQLQSKFVTSRLLFPTLAWEITLGDIALTHISRYIRRKRKWPKYKNSWQEYSLTVFCTHNFQWNALLNANFLHYGSTHRDKWRESTEMSHIERVGWKTFPVGISITMCPGQGFVYLKLRAINTDWVIDES